ncbi:hypothetical protein K488DRAFT_50149 [Vararia minispora EC-137]|uniref:Uncharacterized protein n=1 Tax=Vararia minispora EC-137 TaxID=1314806 RepID=A0ACB8QKH8_9AGAM|nr:hypothetical protein K488DRAFT_50149 [Vararia minispora EC-137]
MATCTETQVLVQEPRILLQPRPLAREPGSILLVPLLPKRPKPVRLPWELWSHILYFVIFDEDVDYNKWNIHSRRTYFRNRWSLLYVCKDWLEAAKPLVYSDVHVFSISSLEKFVSQLHESEQRWDSIRRIPHSTPGRWVLSFDVAEIPTSDPGEPTAVDRLLTKVFPLLPFLSSLCLPGDLTLSSAALASLHAKVGLEHLTTLRGFKIQWRPDNYAPYPALEVLARCTQLERLEIINEGPHAPSFLYSPIIPGSDDPTFFPSAPVLDLPRLSFLSVFAPSLTPVLAALLRAPLPSLQHLMITPSDDLPEGATQALLSIHGANLLTLRLNSPCSWPTLNPGLPPLITALHTSPQLRRLTLDYPLTPLAPPSPGGHPLQVITIPRPNSRFLSSLEAQLPLLPDLAIVRLRNVKWLLNGMYGKALESGVQGEMREWRTRLAKKKVRLVDTNWRDPM